VIGRRIRRGRPAGGAVRPCRLLLRDGPPPGPGGGCQDDDTNLRAYAGQRGRGSCGGDGVVTAGHAGAGRTVVPRAAGGPGGREAGDAGPAVGPGFARRGPNRAGGRPWKPAAARVRRAAASALPCGRIVREFAMRARTVRPGGFPPAMLGQACLPQRRRDHSAGCARNPARPEDLSQRSQRPQRRASDWEGDPKRALRNDFSALSAFSARGISSRRADVCG
jgi:hypothetical protein